MSVSYRVSNLVLRYDDILQETDIAYYPQPGPRDGNLASARGTRIVLRNFGRRRVPPGDRLHRQLAARFGIKRSDWYVQVVDSLNVGKPFAVGDLHIDVLPDTRVDV